MWLLFTSCVLIISFGLGPQSSYSLEKLLLYHRTLVLSIIALVFLMSNKACDMWEVGIMLIIAATVIFSFNIYFHPYLKPDNILEPGGMRIRLRPDDLFYGSFFKDIGYFASMGAVFLICSIDDVFIYRQRKVVFILFLLISLIILNSTGQRLFIINILIAGCGILFSKPKNTKIFLYLNIFLIMILSSIIVTGIVREIPLVEQVFQEGTTITGKLNRGMWDDAIRLYKEKPLLGHGLGGYSADGKRSYPHNLFLELLVETGLVGTVMIFSPLIWFLFIPKIEKLLTLRSAKDQILFPFLLVIFCYAMISNDLINPSFFAISAVFWAYSST